MRILRTVTQNINKMVHYNYILTLNRALTGLTPVVLRHLAGVFSFRAFLLEVI